ITRPIRLRGGLASRDSAHHERPREEWIEIAVPPIVTEGTFALAAERLQANKDHAPRVIASLFTGGPPGAAETSASMAYRQYDRPCRLRADWPANRESPTNG